MSAMVRSAVRNFLYPMTESEMRRELELSIEVGDSVRADYVAEYMRECGYEVWVDSDESCGER